MDRLFKIIQAKFYLNAISFRSKNEQHTEHIENALRQIEFLDSWRDKAIRLINQKQFQINTQEKELKILRSEVLKLKNEATRDNGIIEQQGEVIDRMSDGMVARCDLCGSEK